MPTALLPYCPTALLPYCPTALLPYCPTAPLPHCPTAYCPLSVVRVLATSSSIHSRKATMRGSAAVFSG
ncbi:MAG: hypothetical protein E5Y04_17465 [Mesorhizobium sp.]|nr:MAG: hypothetical protein EOR97_19250 [Mesorhizobium sp.]TJV23802.1 MAG: hypothetical protein E5Y04_17465 [Mesorhizobium sp.]